MSSRLPIGADDERVIFSPERHPKLPDIYIMDNHPQQIGKGRAFYFIYDGTFESAKAIYELEVNELRLKIPQGSHDEAIALGAHISNLIRDFR